LALLKLGSKKTTKKKELDLPIRLLEENVRELIMIGSKWFTSKVMSRLCRTYRQVHSLGGRKRNAAHIKRQ